MMSDSILKLAKTLVRQLSSLDADGRLADILHEDAVLVTPGSTFAASKKSRAEILNYFRNQVFPKFRKAVFTPSDIFIDAGKSVAVIEWDSKLEPASGGSYENKGVWVVHVDDGQIVQVKEYFDTEKVTRNVK